MKTISDHRPLAGPEPSEPKRCAVCGEPMKNHTKYSDLAVGTVITVLVLTFLALCAVYYWG